MQAGMPVPMAGMSPPPPAPPDPMLAIMALAQMAESALGEPEAEEPYRYEPPKPPKPTRAEIVTLAKKDRGDYQAYVEIVAQSRARVALGTSAVFNVDVNAVRAKQIEPYQLTAIQDEFTNMKNWGSGNKPRRKAVLRRPKHREIGQMKQDFCHFLHDEEKIQHLNAYSEDFDLALWDIFLGTGRLAGIDLIDPDDQDCPYTMVLLDPTTVFPTWEGPKSQLSRCTIVREALLGDVIGRYDRDGTLADRFYGMQRQSPDLGTGTGKRDRGQGDYDGRYGPNTQGELIEWYDRAYRAVLFEGEWVIEPTEHDYGEVPITYVMGPIGSSAVMASSPVARMEEVAQGNFVRVLSGTTKDTAVASTGLPFTWFTHTAHDQEESVMTRLYNEVKISNNRSRYIKQGNTAADKDSLKWKTTAGATNWLEPGEEIGWEPTAPDPNSLMPILQSFSQTRATNRIPLSAFGQAPAQTSGYAVESMTETGRERAAGFLQGVANFMRLRDEKRLRYWEKHGSWLGDPDLDGIELPYRFPRDGQDEMFELTPDHIKEAGCRMEVKLTNLRLSNLGNLGNAVKQWRSEGLMSKLKALELRDEEDIEGELAQIDIDELNDDPLLKLPKLLKRLVKEGDIATAQFVEELYRESRMMKDMEQSMMGGGGPPGGMKGGGGPLQLGPGGGGGGGGPGPANVQGLSLPGLGMPPGQQGGRPPQGPRPPMAQSGLPGM